MRESNQDFEQFHEQQKPPEEKETSFESRLEQQYRQQIKTLNETGVLELLPEQDTLGIVGIDGNDYPIPKFESILSEIKTNPECRSLLEKKEEQRLNIMLLVPIAVPVSTLTNRLESLLLQKHKEGKLLATKKQPTDPDEALYLYTTQPLNIRDELKGADETDKLVYFPKSFDRHHEGLTKQQLIDISKSSPFPGFDVLFVEDVANTPAKGKGTTVSGRAQLEANKSPNQYQQLKTQKQYKGETGFTLETYLTYFIHHLHTTNQVIDDWQGAGKATYLIENYVPSSGDVPYGYWLRDDRQGGLDADGPEGSGSSSGSRFAVRMHNFRT